MRDFVDEESELAREDARGVLPLDLPAPVDPAVETLRKARDWLSDPAHWTKCSTGSHGGPTCAIGAIERFNRGSWWGRATWLLSAQLPPMKGTCIINFNDDPSTTHADVLALFDRAIAAAGG